MRRVYQCFAFVFSLLLLITLALIIYMQAVLPDEFYMAKGEEFSLESLLRLEPTMVSTQMPADANKNVTSSYQVDLKFLGIFSVKQVQINEVDRKFVMVGGTPFGIKMFTKGVLVVRQSDVQTAQSVVNPSKDAGIKTGDVILEINSQEVASNDDIVEIVSNCGGKTLDVKLQRGDSQYRVELTPVLASDGQYRVGIWVRDSSAGIGTLTYYDPQNGTFGGLGHAICDVDTGEIMPLDSGELVDVQITGVVRGQNGKPGELKGMFVSDIPIGDIAVNNETGIFGHMTCPNNVKQLMPVAYRHEVKCGKAQVVTTTGSGDPVAYDIEIEKVNYADNNPTKNMVIRVTDEALLAKTGGIIQGMSGSPIIQDGKLIGAVTHVFVNDSTRGYGIFVENMQKTSENLENIQNIA